MANSVENQNQHQTLDLPKPKLRCIVKLGGAAVTRKNELESINEENLGIVCAQLRKAMASSPAARVAGMDWSRRKGKPIDASDLDPVTEISEIGVDSDFIVVHGAAPTASKTSPTAAKQHHSSSNNVCSSSSSVYNNRTASAAAVTATAAAVAADTAAGAGAEAARSSSGSPHPFLVTSLNLEIVRALAQEGIPAVGMSPFACGWSTRERNVASADISQLIKALQTGFVPILHGDAVLDDLQGCTILSGDVIISHLAQLLMPDYVVFLTDVLGVYDRPPTDPDAILLREIAVDEDGDWSIVKPALDHSKGQDVEITVAAHDTTGGMETKILEAAMIAKLGIDVFITKAGTEYSERALKGEVRHAPDDWLGTVIRSVRH